MAVGVIGETDVVHLIGASALHAALHGLLAAQLFLLAHEIVARLLGIHTVIHLTSWESAGKPVQPTYWLSPAELTTMGSSGVPVLIINQLNSSFEDPYDSVGKL